MDLNRVTLIGTLGKDPDYHDMSTGGKLCKFSMATSRRWKDKQTGEQKEDTAWHQIVVFSEYLVKICESWLQKGTKIYLEGELKTRNYEKDGEKRYVTEVVLPSFKGEIIVLARGKGWDVDEMPGSQRRGSSTDGHTNIGAASGLGREPGSDDDFDDDIPF